MGAKLSLPQFPRFEAYSNLGEYLSSGNVKEQKNHRQGLNCQRQLYSLVVPAGPELPWLRLPLTDSCKQVSFFDLSTGEIHKLKIPKSVQGWQCCGSSKGWLLFANGDKSCPKLSLLNPITGKIVRLPCIKTIPTYYDYVNSIPDYDDFSSFIVKIELSCEDPFTISAILDDGSVLAVCKPGDDIWTVFPLEDYVYCYRDILFSDQVLYVLYVETTHDDDDYDVIIDMDDDTNIQLIPDLQPEEEIGGEKYNNFQDCGVESYLVESQTDILIVHRIYDINFPETWEFKVYSLDGKILDGLKDNMLFVGRDCSSESVSARNLNGFQGNCIDSADNYEFGIFSFDDGKTRRFHFSLDNTQSWFRRKFIPRLWVVFCLLLFLFSFF